MTASAPSPLQFFNDSGEPVPLSENDAAAILKLVSEQENATFSFVELVYVNEAEIVRINTEHLGRSYVTDTISFRYDEDSHPAENPGIEGTLFCCAQRIKEQAAEFGEPVEREFKRIFIHGLLHLIGYEDDTPELKAEMSRLEDTYLALFKANN